MSRAIVLFSGGQDSTTCLYLAKQLYDEVHAVSIFYGQRHASELEAAAEIVKLAKVDHTVLHLDALGEIGDSALVRAGQELTGEGGRSDHAAPNGLPSSFVPGRNLLFLSLAASVAVKLGVQDIITGVCQTDYSGYPDCRREFIDVLEKAATLAMPSSAGPMRVVTPLMYMTKAETVRMAARLPGCLDALKLSVTCYNGLRPGCGTCAACVLRAQGFSSAGLTDPAQA